MLGNWHEGTVDERPGDRQKIKLPSVQAQKAEPYIGGMLGEYELILAIGSSMA
jgi:hypothetical protein